MPPLTLSLRYNNPRWNIVFTSYDDYGITKWLANWQHDGSSILIVRDDTYTFLEYNYTDAITGVGAAAFHAVDSSGAHHVLEPTGPSDPNGGLNPQMESIDATGLQLASGFVSANGLLYVPVIDSQGIRHLAPLIKQDDTTGIQLPGPLLTVQNGFRETTQDPSGNVITPQVTLNGSMITVNGWVDAIGRFIPAPNQHLDLNTSPASYCETLNFPATNGGTPPLPFFYNSATLQSPVLTPFARFTAPKWSTILPRLTLPNLTRRLFYHHNVCDISSVTLPTGGVISYTWAKIGRAHV